MGRAVLRLVPPPGQVSADRLSFDGIDLLAADEAAMRAVRGRRIAMVMQDPKFSLNPVMTVGAQIREAYRAHARVSRPRPSNARSTCWPRSASAIQSGSTLLSARGVGGMGQRVMIAMMLVGDPDVLIADEPTSALDVTVELQVLAILDDLVSERGLGLILISHDLNLVASFCDRVLIMYAGQVVETCAAGELHQARHPYTRGLLAALPRIDGGPAVCRCCAATSRSSDAGWRWCDERGLVSGAANRHSSSSAQIVRLGLNLVPFGAKPGLNIEGKGHQAGRARCSA